VQPHFQRKSALRVPQPHRQHFTRLRRQRNIRSRAPAGFDRLRQGERRNSLTLALHLRQVCIAPVIQCMIPGDHRTRQLGDNQEPGNRQAYSTVRRDVFVQETTLVLIFQ